MTDLIEREVGKDKPPEIAGAPRDLQRQWQGIYDKELAQAKVDSPNDPHAQTQAARRAANRLISVDPPENYAAAMKLEPWKFLKREAADGKLCIVTIDGKKLFYDVPN
jgi:hypothetical protein